MMLHPSHAILSSQNGIGLNRRTLNIGAVAVLHIALLWGFAHAVSSGKFETITPPFDAKLIDDPTPAVEAPVPKPALADPTKVTYVAPTFDIAPDKPSGGEINVQSRVEPLPLVVNKIPDVGPVAANARTIPPYPAIAERLGSEGTVTLRVTISEIGAVTAADLVKSSGSKDLDRAAIEWVVAHWKYKPAIRGGQPVASSTNVSMTFTLTGRR